MFVPEEKCWGKTNIPSEPPGSAYGAILALTGAERRTAGWLQASGLVVD